MKIALFEMNTHPCITPEAIATVARAAEQAGFESIWGGEHLILPDPAVRFPPDRVIIDLIATIAFAAAHTRTLRFGTGSSCCRSVIRWCWRRRSPRSTFCAADV